VAGVIQKGSSSFVVVFSEKGKQGKATRCLWLQSDVLLGTTGFLNLRHVPFTLFRIHCSVLTRYLPTYLPAQWSGCPGQHLGPSCMAEGVILPDSGDHIEVDQWGWEAFAVDRSGGPARLHPGAVFDEKLQ
jgi:hypothetical protein